MPSAWRALATCAALALVGLGLAGDALGGGAPSMGPLQWLLVTFGVLLLPLGLLSGPWLLRHGVFLAVVASIYATLLAFEIASSRALGPGRDSHFALVGGYRPSRWGGYEFAPGWRGFYDDGRTRVAVDLNSHGDRDDEPEPQPRDAERRLLLLGDSQAFGMGLAREETIERQVETLSSGQVAAYNLGVPGYGPGDSLERYRERADLSARWVFFLLYGNDLRHDNCRAGFHTAFEGFVVTRDRPDGRPYSADELRQGLREARAASARSWIPRIKGVALLEQLRGRFQALRDPEALLLAGRAADFSEACSRSAARAADAMRALAREREQVFAVVVLPTVWEATLQRYSSPMQQALAELERLAVPTLEVRALLSRADYLPRDEHLAERGARKVAGEILRAVR